MVSGGLYHKGLCFITDRAGCPLSNVEMAEMALSAGIGWVQLRDKSQSRRGIYSAAMHIRKLSELHGACFIVNDFPDIAAAVNADGVHLGQDDIPVAEARKIIGKGKLVGISTHSVENAIKAERDGADYIGFGPVYLTSTKDGAGNPRGVEMLARVREAVSIPVVAIGGITCDRLPEVIGAGAAAVAVASALLTGRIEQNVHTFIDTLQKHCH